MLYRRVTDELSLHQILLLSANEVRKLLPQLPSILHDAEDYFLTKWIEHQLHKIQYKSLQAVVPQKMKKLSTECGTLVRAPEEKYSCIYYDRSDYSRTYFNIRLYTRAAPIDNFDRKGVLCAFI